MRKIDEYAAEAKAAGGTTDAYQEYEQKSPECMPGTAASQTTLTRLEVKVLQNLLMKRSKNIVEKRNKVLPVLYKTGNTSFKA